jgi:hypothetical protein
VRSIHEGLRRNLVARVYDLFNRYSFFAAVYLPVRSSDPAEMVLSRAVTNIPTGN